MIATYRVPRAFPVPANLNTTSLVSTGPLPTCDVCVVVPVRDEADHLEETLTTLANQTDLDGSPLDPAGYEIILLANNCRDDSAGIARRFASRRPGLSLHVVARTLPEAIAHVGTSRRMLMDEACSRLMALDRPGGIIATTDGDTLASPTWIAATRAEVRRGADAVGGRISIDPAALRSRSPGMLR